MKPHQCEECEDYEIYKRLFENHVQELFGADALELIRMMTKRDITEATLSSLNRNIAEKEREV